MHRMRSMFSAKTSPLPLWEQTCAGFYFHFHQIFAISTVSKLYPNQLHTSQLTNENFKLHSKRTETVSWEKKSTFSTNKAIQSYKGNLHAAAISGPVYTLQEVFEFTNGIQKRLKRIYQWIYQRLSSLVCPNSPEFQHVLFKELKNYYFQENNIITFLRVKVLIFFIMIYF